MSTSELRELVADLAQSTKELRESQLETDRQIKETYRQMKRTNKNLAQQIGGLGNKFGTFAEGLAYPSIKRMLRDDFGIDDLVTPGVKMRRGGREEEYDVLAYSNGNVNKGMIVEIKSKLRQEDIDQMKRKMDEVFFWLPEHKNKTFYGMIAYVSGHEDLIKQIIKNGWYLARVGEEIFEMETSPADFKAREYRSE